MGLISRIHSKLLHINKNCPLSSKPERKNEQRISIGNSQKRKPKGLTVFATQRKLNENKILYWQKLSIRKERRYGNPRSLLMMRV